MNLVPTASTTAALAIGDALAMTLLVEKGFRAGDFANLHPGGNLGKRLTRVEALMHSGKDCPIVRTDAQMRDVIYEMSSKQFGMTCVIDRDDDTLLGHHHRRRSAAADGTRRRDPGPDGRRCDVDAPGIGRAARWPPRRLNIMEQRKITSIVVAEDGPVPRVAGVLHLHDLWRMEMF